MNGLLTLHAGGEVIWSYCPHSISHDVLKEEAEKAHGPIKMLMWAGEIVADPDGTIQKILVMDETAGIMERETPGIEVKVSNVDVFAHYYEKHPKFREVLGLKPELIHYDRERPGAEQHLFTDGKAMADFRHDIRGPILSINALWAMHKDGDLSFEDVRRENQMIKDAAKKSYDLFGPAEEHGVRSAYMTAEDWSTFKNTLKEIMDEGVVEDEVVNDRRFGFIAANAWVFGTSDDVHVVHIETDPSLLAPKP